VKNGPATAAMSGDGGLGIVVGPGLTRTDVVGGSGVQAEPRIGLARLQSGCRIAGLQPDDCMESRVTVELSDNPTVGFDY
jgi:hypothetical protein